MKYVLALILIALLVVVVKPAFDAVHIYRTASVCADHGGTMGRTTVDGHTLTLCNDGNAVLL